MKEYIAGTGGRYTYVDDLLNLQNLALSLTSIYDGCSNFVISGCKVAGGKMSPGYVWLNGKVRYFAGDSNISYPYYIYELNSIESIVYANDINKAGRNNYSCSGGISVPTITDPITNKFPDYFAITEVYTPRFIDKFMGHYAILCNSPFNLQSLKNNLHISGALQVNQGIDSHSTINIKHLVNGFKFKAEINTIGELSFALFDEVKIASEIKLDKTSMVFCLGNKEIANINNTGLSSIALITSDLTAGAVNIINNCLINIKDSTDNGEISINIRGYQNGNNRFRNFSVYNGITTDKPILHIIGSKNSLAVNGLFTIHSKGQGLNLLNADYDKSDKKLKNSLNWLDSLGETIAHVGYATTDTYALSFHNSLGTIELSASYIDMLGELKINGKNITESFVALSTFNTELAKKIDKISGKQLSSEDFTFVLKTKLEKISTSTIISKDSGYVVASDVAGSLAKKLSISSNLSDLENFANARDNLSVYSKNESNITYLRISGGLKELVSLTADEINNLTGEAAALLRATKQAAIREIIDAEQKGVGEYKLSKNANFSDIKDIAQARKNLGVYSIEEMNKLLEKKLSTESAYQGVPFTHELRQKLEDIRTGRFTGVDGEGVAIKQEEGFVLTSHVLKELSKKANYLLDGYSSNEIVEIVSNLGICSLEAANKTYASIGSLFQDYITHIVKGGKTTAEAQKILRGKLDVLGKSEIAELYIKKDGKLTDLNLPDASAKKNACNHLGAAYSADYQVKLLDTGWVKMLNAGSGTDASRLFIRQIGNIVSIQGIINTARREGSNWGGTVAVVPNNIPPPKYALRTTSTSFDDDHKYNRGASFIMPANDRRIILYESGYNNITTEINFTYMI